MTGFDTSNVNHTVCNSISVDPDDPLTTYLTIGGAVKGDGQVAEASIAAGTPARAGRG